MRRWCRDDQFKAEGSRGCPHGEKCRYAHPKNESQRKRWWTHAPVDKVLVAMHREGVLTINAWCEKDRKFFQGDPDIDLTGCWSVYSRCTFYHAHNRHEHKALGRVRYILENTKRKPCPFAEKDIVCPQGIHCRDDHSAYKVHGEVRDAILSQHRETREDHPNFFDILGYGDATTEEEVEGETSSTDSGISSGKEEADDDDTPKTKRTLSPPVEVIIYGDTEYYRYV